MATGLLFDADVLVASFLFRKYGQKALKFDRAIGLLGKDKTLQGVILFHNWNGSNVELSYYGQNTMTAGVIRCIARFAIYTFDPSRVTVVTSKKNRRFMRVFRRFGFSLEGMQRCHYGKQDNVRNTGVRFVMFRNRINDIAKIDSKAKKAVARC